MNYWQVAVGLLTMFAHGAVALAAGAEPGVLPFPLDSYPAVDTGILDTLIARFEQQPFNLVSALIFVGAILHTFFASYFMQLSHDVQHRHTQKLIAKGTIGKSHNDQSFLAQVLHFFGEVEAIFGIWVIPLLFAITTQFGWGEVVSYVQGRVNYTEPVFVVVIMIIASTRPVLNFSENLLKKVAAFGKGTPSAWWLTILILAPLLGSLITEPAAMTIAALLLCTKFYRLKPSSTLRYATLGLLFVNVSVGGTLTNFAAPPVLMVAAPWGWSSWFMLVNFGWKAAVGIVIATMAYYFAFRKELMAINQAEKEHKQGDIEVSSDDHTDLVPLWVTGVHMLFLLWTVVNAHYPVLFLGGFLFFLGFYHSTEQHQNKLELKSSILVGFFLAGLVTHGGLQGWWIAPVLGSLSEVPLMVASVVLTSFNDNAAITYLSTLVPGFSDSMKYAVVAGAVTGGGLTVIANAPNPAGQSIISKYMPKKQVKPLNLFLGAIVPTIILGIVFMVL